MSIIKKKFIFNISPTRVAGAITYFDNNKKIPVVEYLTQEKINLKKDFSLKDFRKETLKAIDSVCNDFILENKIMGNENIFIEDAEVFLMSPWIDYENYSLKDESLTPFLVNDKYLDNFLLKKNTYKDKDILSSDITSITANDYNVDLLDLRNKKIQKINVSFLDSFLLKFDKHFIDGAIRNNFSLLNIKMNSFLPVLFNQIRKIYNPKDDFIFLDISSEITDFGIFSDGKVSHMMSIPFGINKIINEIMDVKKVSDSYKAKTFLNMFFSNHLNFNDMELVRKIINKNTDILKREVEGILEDDGGRLPLNTFVISSAWETNKILKESGIFKNIYFIGEKLLENFVEFKTGDRDNFIAVETEYVYDN